MPLDPYSTVPMKHYELSSLSPISLEGVWSSWEIERKLRFDSLHPHSTLYYQHNLTQACLSINLVN